VAALAKDSNTGLVHDFPVCSAAMLTGALATPSDDGLTTAFVLATDLL
jgi:hypothetical protein